MAVTLEELEIFLGVTDNLQSAYQRVDQFATKTEARFKTVQTTMDRAMGKDLLLRYKVDDSALTAANKHLESKRSHLREVQQWMNQNPLTYKVDLSAVKTARADIAGLKSEMRSLSSTLNQQGRITVEYSINASSFIDKFEKAGDRIAEKIGKTKLSTGGGGLFGGLMSIPGAIVQGIGIQVGERISRGFSKSADASLEAFGRGLDKQINRAMQTMTIGLAKAGGYASAKDFRKDASQTIDNLTNFSPRRVAKAVRKLENDLVDILESAVVDGDQSAVQAKLKKLQKEMLERPIEAAMNTAGAALRIGAQPFRIRKRVELARTVKEAEGMVDEILQNMSDELKAEVKKAKGVTIATGGVDYQKGGENTYFSANLVRKLTPGNVTIPVPNAYSNDPSTLGGLYQVRQSIYPGKPMPVDRLLQTAIETGRNPDAARMLAQAMAVRKIAPDTPITFTGSSGGAALVEEVIGAAERAAMTKIKGIGLTLPGFDLTRTASKANYQTLVGTYDPISMAAFGSRFSDQSRYFNRAMGSSPVPIDTKGLLTPGKATALFPGIGMGHHLADFLSDAGVQRKFSAFAGTGPIDPGYTNDRKSFEFANKLYSESQAIPRTIGVLLGDLKALAEVAKGEYSFIDPGHPEYRRDNDFAAMSSNFEKLKVTGPDTEEYQKFLEWLKVFKKELTSFYEVGALQEGPISKGLINAAQEGQQFFKFREGTYQPEYSPPKTIIEKAQEQINAIAETGKEIIAAERKVANAFLELENTLTLGLASKYRQFLGNQARETVGMVASGAAAYGRQVLLPGAARSIMGGYGALQGAERAVLGIAPFGLGYGAKGLIQAGAGFAAINAVAPGVGGVITGAGGASGGALATQLGHALTAAAVDSAPGLVAPIVNAFGSGLTALLGAGGAALGASAAAIGAGSTGVNLAGKLTARLIPDPIKEELLLPQSQAAQNVGKKLGQSVTSRIIEGAQQAIKLQTQLQIPKSVIGENLLSAVNQQVQDRRQTLRLSGAGETISALRNRISQYNAKPLLSQEDIANLKVALLLVERISATLEETKGPANRIFNEFPGQFEAQFQSMLGNKGQLGRLQNNALDAISKFAPSIKGAAEAGDSTAQGFILSLERAMPGIERVARGNALNYVRAIKRELGIASPSRVMIKIGQDVVAGFEIGLEDIDRLWPRLARNLEATPLENKFEEIFAQIDQKVRQGVEDVNIEFDRLGNFTTLADNARTVGGNASGFVSNSGEATRKELEHQLNQVPFEEIGKRAGVATAEGIGVATEAMDQLGQTVDLVFQNISPMFGAFYQQVRQQFSEIDRLGEFKGLAKSALIVGAAVVAWSMFGQQVTATFNATADAALEQNRMNRILDQLVAGGGEKYYARLADQSNRFGANLQQAAKSAASLETSLLNKTLAGQGVEILSGFQAQFAAQGTPLEDQQRALVGVEQALRKGKLQAEELYQVVEPLPGSMEALQAATGKTGAELFRATAAGEVFTEDVIQSWSNQLKAMSGLADGANTAEASMGRLQNQVYLLSANTGQLTNSIRKAGTDVLAVGLDVANKNSEALNATLLALGGSTLIGLGSALFFAGQSLVAFITQTAVGQAALNAFMGGVTLVTRAIIPLSVAIAAIGTAKLAWDMSRPREEIQRTIDKLKQLQSEINKTAEPSTRENRFIVTPEKIKAEADKRGAIEAASLTRETIESLNKKTVAILKQGDALGRIQELYQKIAQLDAQIAINLSDGNTEAAAKKRQEVIELRRELNKKLTDTGIEDAKSRYSILQSEAKKAIDAINKQEQETGKIDKRLSEVKATQKENLELAIQWADALNRAASVDFSNIAQANSLLEQRVGSIDRREAEAKIRQAQNDTAIVSQLGGLGVSNQQRLQSEQLNRRILTLQESADFLQDRINSTSDAIAQIDIDPAAIGLKEALADLGTRVKDATATQFDAAIKKLEAEGKSPSDDLKSLIDQAKGNKELQEQFALKAGEIEQAKVDLKESDLEQANARIDYLRNIEQSNYDLKKSIEDNQRALRRQFEDTIQETKQLFSDLGKIKLRNDLNSKIQTISGDFSDTVLSSLQSFFDKVAEAMDAKLAGQGVKTGLDRKLEDLDLSQIDYQRNIRSQKQGIADAEAAQIGAAKSFTVGSWQDASGEPGTDFTMYNAAGKYVGVPLALPNKAEVLRVDENRGGYGKSLEVRFEYLGQKFDALIAHFDKLNPALRAGMVVPPGTLLGTQGYSGHTIPSGPEGTHTSFDMYRAGSNVGAPDALRIKYIKDELIPFLKSGGIGAGVSPKSSGSSRVVMTDTGAVDSNGLKLFKVDVIDANGNVIFSEAAYSGKAGAQQLQTASQGIPGSRKPIPEGRYSIGQYETGNFGKVGDRWIGIESQVGGQRGAFGFHADIDGIPGSDGCIVFTNPATVKKLADAVIASGAKDLYVDYGLGTIAKQTKQSAPLATAIAPIAQSDDAQNVANAINQQYPLQDQLSAEKQRAAQLDADKILRDLKNQIEIKTSDLLSAQVGLQSQSKQRELDLLPQTPLIGVLSQFNSKQTADAQAIIKQEIEAASLQRDIDKFSKIISLAKGKGLDTTAMEEFRKQAILNKAAIDENNKAISNTSPIKTLDRELRIATNSQLDNADSMAKQIDSMQTLLTGMAPVSGVSRDIAAQFRNAHEQLKQFGDGVDATIAAFNKAAREAEGKGLKSVADQLKAAANSLKFGAIAIRDAAQNALSPAAQDIAAANARLDALFKVRQNARKFSDPLRQQQIDNADLKAQILESDNDPFGANAIKLKNQLLQKQQEITDKILANELEIEKQRNLQTLEQSSPFTRTSGPRDFFGIDPGVQISDINAVQIFPKQGSIDDVVDQIAIAKTEALAAISDALKAPAISSFETIDGENFFTQSLDSLQERLTELDASTAIDQLGNWNDALRESLGLTQELAQRQLPTLERSIKNSFAEGGGDAVSTFFNDLWQGKDILTSLSDAFQAFADKVIQNLIDMAAQAAMSWIKNLLFGAIGGGGSGLGTSIFTAYAGGRVENFANGGIPSPTAISAALDRERIQSGGLEPRLVVANTKERILNPEETKLWEIITKYGFRNENYALGGTPGGGSSMDGSSLATRSGSNNSFGDFIFNGGGSMSPEEAAQLRKDVAGFIDKRIQDTEIQRRRSGR